LTTPNFLGNTNIYTKLGGDIYMAVKKRMSTLDWLAWSLVVVGALNWGFVGVSNLNVIDSLLSSSPSLVQVVYILVGLSGLYQVWVMLGNQK